MICLDKKKGDWVRNMNEWRNRSQVWIVLCIMAIVALPVDLTIHRNLCVQAAAEMKNPTAIRFDVNSLLARGKYSAIFQKQLDLLFSEYWQESGDWIGAEMNDAGAYAPSLLFKIYTKTGNEEIYRRAMKTCEFQKTLLGEVVMGKRNLTIMSAGGVLCFLDAMQHAKSDTERKAFCDLVKLLLMFCESALVSDAEQKLMPTFGEYKSFTYPLTAAYALEYYQLTKENQSLRIGIKLLEQFEKDCCDLEKEHHERDVWSTPAAISAFAKAFEVTGDKQYLTKADALITHQRDKDRNFSAIFYGDRDVREELHRTEYLSTILFYLKAHIELYRLTGREKYLEAVGRALDFCKRELILSRIYPDGVQDKWFNNRRRIVPFCSHDIRRKNAELYVAPRYCVGCSFLLLDMIWDYNNMTPISESEEKTSR